MLCFQSVLYCIVLYNDVFTFLYVAVGNKLLLLLLLRERLSLAGSTDGGVNVSSSRLATLRRFGADGPGWGGPPHCTVLSWWSRFHFRPNELLHTAHTKGFGLQRLECLTKCPRLANARPHVEHICIVIGQISTASWRHSRKSLDCTSEKCHLRCGHET